jgi:transcriptional regulator with XRE-family HTH domain
MAETTYADNLRRLIGVHRTNQLAVGQAAGVTRQTIAELVTSVRSEPSIKTLYATAELFQVEPDNLLRRPFWEWAPDYFAKIAAGKHREIAMKLRGAQAALDPVLDPPEARP